MKKLFLFASVFLFLVSVGFSTAHAIESKGVIKGYIENKIIAPVAPNTIVYPVNVVLKTSILPANCSVHAKAMGLLSSERVYLALNAITCSGKSKSVVGFVNSYNGKTGLIGNVIIRSKKAYLVVKPGTKVTMVFLGK